jgi:dTDP-glucose 4,6-dehydratase
MKILITGGAGFIGSAFVKLAAKKGLALGVLDKLTYAGDFRRIEGAKGVRFYHHDISDRPSVEDLFKKEGFDSVVHFAAETHVDRSIINPDIFTQTNVAGTTCLLELSLKYGIKRFIHISTDEVYGELNSGDSIKFKETDPLLPNSPYSASKASADMFVRAYYRTYGLPVIVVRPSNNYGQWQYPEKLIPLFIAKLLMGEKLPVYGKGENIRTWLFVEDCVDAIFQILERGSIGEIYNIGSNDEWRNIDVVRLLIKLMDKEEDMIDFVPDRPGHDFRYAVDTTKIQSEFGWFPSVSFEDGLRKTVAWYLANRDWLFSKKKEMEDFLTLLKENYKKHNRTAK